MESNNMETEDEIFWTSNGKEYCNEELALSVLLKNGVLFCNERDFLDIDFVTNKDGAVIGAKPNSKVGGFTTLLFVNCNDIFSWGSADSEDLPNSEIGNLYRMHMADRNWGVAKWCSFRRKLKPQKPVIEAMKKDGSWDDKMEALPNNVE